MEAPVPLLIFPFNGNGREALDCVTGRYFCIGFIDDTLEKRESQYCGIEVFARDALSRFPEAMVLAVPGGPSSYLKRESVIAGLDIPADRFATIIHPAASISKASKIGVNVLLMAGVVVTSNATISDHACILPNSVIHHDATIGRATLIGANVTVAGGAAVAERCYIGAGSNIKNGISIGAGSMIGLGSNVVKDIPPNVTAFGNPAKWFNLDYLKRA